MDRRARLLISWSAAAGAVAGLAAAAWAWKLVASTPGTDGPDAGFAFGLLMGAPVSFVALLAVYLLHLVGLDAPTGDVGMALWLAAVPLNWALFAGLLARLLTRMFSPPRPQ